MSRLLAPGAVLVLLLAGCATKPGGDGPLDGPAPVLLDAEGFVPIQFRGMRFLEQDLAGGDATLRLHADIYLPDDPINATSPTKFPTILLLSPYWGGGSQGQPYLGYTPYDFLVGRLLPRGYAVVFGDLGGNGGSSGCWDFMGPTERASAYAMVEAIAAQDWSDGQVGMFGLSYDGMTQVMAASDAAPHLVTVVPASALTEAYKGLKMSGVHYGGGWHATIASYEQSSVMGPSPANEARRAGWIETVQRSPQCMLDNHMGDQATGAYTDFYRERDFRPLAPDVKASVFVTQGFLDAAVKPDNFGEWFAGIETPKKAWLGWWFHQYPTASAAGRTDMYLEFHRWFDHELLGVENGVLDGPVLDVQDSQGRWRHEATWPPHDANLTVLVAGADRKLAPTGSAGQLPFGGPAGVTDLAIGDGGGSLTLGTGPLAEGLHITGVPAFDAEFTPRQASGYVIARLYDVAPGGAARMITQGAANALFAGGLDAPQPLQPGEAVRLRVTMYPTDWAVPAGNEVRLVLSTLDGQAWFDPDPGVSFFDLTTGDGARLELPTVARADDAFFLTSCGEVFEDVGCYMDLKDEGVPEDGYLA